ncbi:MAG: tetratricopeptide repeat protein, partial [Kofleriaceae bacterium]
MIELYSIRDVARILAVQEARLRYWMQTGFVGPTVRKGGRFYYTFTDLVAVKSAKDLLAADITLQAARKAVEALRKALPADTHPASRMRVCSDGTTIVALADDVAFEPIGGQVVMAFSLASFGEHVSNVLAMPRVGPNNVHSGPIRSGGTPEEITDSPTEANGGTTAYRHFVEACAAEDRGDSQTAEHLFRQAIDLEPNMSAALTNLGNLVYRQGELEDARRFYERALDHDPLQAEARYNLANLLEDLGETELAIAELRRVCAACPDFADAHYNLGLMLAQVGGTAQAKQHLER